MGPAIITAFLWRWLIGSKCHNLWSRGLGTAFLKSFHLSLGILVKTSTLAVITVHLYVFLIKERSVML